MISMNFPTLPYDHVTNSFLLEIWFCGPTYPTFLYDVTLCSLFFKSFLKDKILDTEWCLITTKSLSKMMRL